MVQGLRLRRLRRCGHKRLSSQAVEESGNDGVPAVVPAVRGSETASEPRRHRASNDGVLIPRPPAHSTSCRFRAKCWCVVACFRLGA